MFLDLCGAKLHFEQYGEGKPDVLLLHGWGCSIETWKAVTDRLARHSRVTVIDFPAHGQSGRPPEPWGAHEFSEQVAAQMARGVAKTAESNVGVGITGIAGPGGGTAKKPVGMVCFGFCVQDQVQTYTCQFGNLGRNRVRESAVKFVFSKLLEIL